MGQVPQKFTTKTVGGTELSVKKMEKKSNGAFKVFRKLCYKVSCDSLGWKDVILPELSFQISQKLLA